MPTGPAAPRVALRVLTWPLRLAGHAVGWARGAPRWLQGVLAVGVLVGGGGGGALAVQRWATGRAHRATLEGWTKFNEAARTSDAAAMEAALDEVLAANPTEPTALGRKRAFATGEAPDHDKPMILYTMRRKLRDNDLPAAAREADKWLRHQPKDWLAHCAKASEALARGDRAAALAEVEALPDPAEEGANVDPGGLLIAFRLYRTLERDTSRLRGFVQGRVCPLLKAGSVQNLAPADKLGLVACYLEGFEPPAAGAQPSPLLLAWSPVTALMDAAADEALARDAEPLLARVGGTGPGLAAAVAAFRRADQVTAEQAADFTREVHERTRKCYGRLRDKDPKAAEAYRGLAGLLAAEGRYAEARDEVVRGLQNCENDPELAALFSRMLQAEGRALESYGALRALAAREPHRPVWCGLAVTAAVAANRADLALADCAAMLQALPGNPWAARAEAGLWLDAGDAARAAQLLAPLGVAYLAKDAEAARLYARALGSAGLQVQVPAFLAEAERFAQEYDNPAALAGALRGQVEAKPDAAGAARVAAECQRFLGRWPEAGEFHRLRAEALYRAAALTAPDWDAGKVAAAAQAAERLRARQPADRAAAVMLVTLRLRGGRAAAAEEVGQAYRDAAPLRDAEADPLLSVDELEALGASYRAAGKLADAARVLERLARSAAARPGGHVQLALTYLAQKRVPEARAALALAQTRPRSPQEQADYVAAVRQLQQETP